MYTTDEAIGLFIKGLDAVLNHPSLGEKWLAEYMPMVFKTYRVEEYLFSPSPELLQRIENYIQWCDGKRTEDAGQLMEEIALLTFLSVKGEKSLKSFQSYGPQVDLSVTGSDGNWRILCSHLRIDWNQRTICVEAKNINDKVDDQQFGRFCSIVEHMFRNDCLVGVFFTRSGASGLPEESDTATSLTIRKRGLRDAAATQLLFHARTRKYVVVFDDLDIRSLTVRGSFVQVLNKKLRQVEEWTGLPSSFTEKYVEVDLPRHLRKHCGDSAAG